MPGTINKPLKKPFHPRWFLKLQWLIIPLLIVIAVEYILRKSDLAIPLWYSRAEAIARHEKVDFLFIGSSKVAAAFIETTFSDWMAAHLGRKIVSLNLGQGYSSPQLHYLGLRNLIQKYPQSFKKITLFIEAIDDTPLYQYHGTWKSRWITQQPQLLVPLLQFSDLGPFWKTRGTPAKEKLYITIKYLMSQSYIFTFRERARQKFQQEGQKLLERMVRWVFRLPALPEAKPNIRGIGGIKTNPDDLEKIREFALKYYADLSRQRRFLKQWDKSVLADIIALIKKQGGDVFLVNLPVFSGELTAYRSETHTRNKRIIKKQLVKWGTAILTPNFSYTDADIPDYFHLRLSRAREFTKKLAQKYVEFKHVPR